MFPIQFDFRVLESLPAPEQEEITRVIQILRTLMHRRVLPFFRKRGTDPGKINRQAELLVIERLDDEANRIRTVSIITKGEKNWTIHIHERVFDYLAFVFPTHPDSKLGGDRGEEGKMLAFSEFLLRHEIEHALHPEKTEKEVILSDVDFAMDRRAEDPTFYRMLRNALADEMTGLKGQPYLKLFNAAEQEQTSEDLIFLILSELAACLADGPEELVEGLFFILDGDMALRLLGEYFRRSRNTAYSLMGRTNFLRRVLRLFSILIAGDEKKAVDIFKTFRERWGLMDLFRELDLSDRNLEGLDMQEAYSFFKGALKNLTEQLTIRLPAAPPSPVPAVRAVEPAPPPVKSLKDRIEAVRNDPAFPRQALEVIDKNRASAIGQSGPKYTELIETLLAIPWGKTHWIEVSPEAFEQGLNSTHYGLQGPKEMVCDFFTNLIWRYQQWGRDKNFRPRRTGSAFLFVGPPGVGKTSFAISIAQNLGIPYHKVSLGGMRDETDMKGHGFTYEGSKPGAIVQGLIKMGVMNGMFILDEADKTEKFAIAPLLEILDPEQNHLFHDKYTETTIDIDLSNCQFILTANTLETVPAPVVNRCEVVVLNRYSIEEKLAIARHHLIGRVRERHQIGPEAIHFDPEQEEDLIRLLIKDYTYEPGVRELERIIRTLFLRVLRREILLGGKPSVRLTRRKIKENLRAPRRPWKINEEDRIGEMLALGVVVELGIGSIIPIQATPIRLGTEIEGRRQSFLSMVQATGNIQKIMDESRKVATTGILHCAETLGIKLEQIEAPIHLHFMGASTPKDGPSAGGAIALALTSALTGRTIRRDVAMTGEIDTQGRITPIGGLAEKLETACDAGCRTMILPQDNLFGPDGIERLPTALKEELQILTYPEWQAEHPAFDYDRHILQVVGVEHIGQAAHIAFIDQEEMTALEARFLPYGKSIQPLYSEAPGERRSCLPIFYAKDEGELDLEGLPERVWQRCQAAFLVRPELKRRLEEKGGLPQGQAKLLDFDPNGKEMAPIVSMIQEHLNSEAFWPAYQTLIAPFYFLIREEQSLRKIPGLRLFANNYAFQGVKIKNCKAVLNRVAFHLAQLTETELAACPFWVKQNGIYVVDLSFIPEKYRLDIKRAEKILEAALRKWLAVVEDADTIGREQ
ncbi:MAG: AAA family ATPase [Deltaproteobacteria bacterium]|nr:AAA family ATPase [Deltaproteobacteria bacterium]